MPPETRRFDPARRWKGEDAAGKTLIIYNEQGLGDTVQFCRYLPLMRGKADHLIVQTQAALMPPISLSRPASRSSIAAGAPYGSPRRIRPWAVFPAWSLPPLLLPSSF